MRIVTLSKERNRGQKNGKERKISNRDKKNYIRRKEQINKIKERKRKSLPLFKEIQTTKNKNKREFKK